MKKYINSIILLSIACILMFCSLFEMGCFGWHHPERIGNDPMTDNAYGVIHGLLGLFALFWSGRLTGRGLSRSLYLYLNDGQVVRLRGFWTVSETTFVMVELKPGAIRLLRLDDDDSFKETISNLTIGHWYRFLDNKFASIPIGEKS